MIERLPLPALLIDPDTLDSSPAASSRPPFLQSGDGSLEGGNLFDVAALLLSRLRPRTHRGSRGGSARDDHSRRGAVRLTQVRVLQVAHKGRRLAFLTIEDATEVFCLKAALDTSEYAALVVDAGGRVLRIQQALGGLFGSAQLGMDAAHLLSQSNAGPRWWEPGLTGRRKMHVEIGSRIYQVTSSAVALAGRGGADFRGLVPPRRERGHSRFSADGLDDADEHLTAAAMRFVYLRIAAAAACSLAPCVVLAAATRPRLDDGLDLDSDDRIAVSADGQTLTGTNGGGGASLGWLHNFDADTILRCRGRAAVLGQCALDLRLAQRIVDAGAGRPAIQLVRRSARGRGR